MTLADLHMHSTYSDGRLTPTELVRLLARRGLTVAALTDHDSTEGVDEAQAEAAGHPGLRLIAGVEISADHPTEASADVHVLGYFVNHHDEAFRAKLRDFRDQRFDRGRLMVERLKELGYELEWERVLAIAGEAGVGRPHVARVLVERGYLASERDAFQGLLEDGGKAHISRPHVSVAEAVQMIRGAGGAAVLAHPLYLTDMDATIEHAASVGVVGMEVHYAEFTTPQRRSLLKTAGQYGLLPCGGSDYHAVGHEGEHLPGEAGPPLEIVQQLERLARAGRGAR